MISSGLHAVIGGLATGCVLFVQRLGWSSDVVSVNIKWYVTRAAPWVFFHLHNAVKALEILNYKALEIQTCDTSTAIKLEWLVSSNNLKQISLNMNSIIIN